MAEGVAEEGVLRRGWEGLGAGEKGLRRGLVELKPKQIEANGERESGGAVLGMGVWGCVCPSVAMATRARLQVAGERACMGTAPEADPLRFCCRCPTATANRCVGSSRFCGGSRLSRGRGWEALASPITTATSSRRL